MSSPAMLTMDGVMAHAPALPKAISKLAAAAVVAAFVTEFGPCDGTSCAEPFATIGHVATTFCLLVGVVGGSGYTAYKLFVSHCRPKKVAPVLPLTREDTEQS